MTEPTAMQGSYVHLKFIGGRKVCQMWIEFDIAHSERLIAMFGTPNPETDTPVAVARLKAVSVAEANKQLADKPAEHWNEMKLVKQAGIRCGEKAFWKWLNVKYAIVHEISDDDEAARLVRSLCNVMSRAQFDTDSEAGKRWQALDLEYQQATGRMARE